jgi:hypothetical protein
MITRREAVEALDDEPVEAQGFDTVEALVLDLLEWIGSAQRPYAEVMEAWRTSCPRLPVWEEATQRGLVLRHHVQGGASLVSLSPAGAEHVRKHRGAGSA